MYLARFYFVVVDPNIRSQEENFTPLHFAARYTPRIVDRSVQLQESEADAGGHAVEVGKLSTSGRVMQYLVNLKKEKRVKASWFVLNVMATQ